MTRYGIFDISGIQNTTGITHNGATGLGLGIFVNTLSDNGVSDFDVEGIASSPLYQGTIYQKNTIS